MAGPALTDLSSLSGLLSGLLSTALGLATLYATMIRPVLKKHREAMEKAVEEAGATATWRTETAARIKALEKSEPTLRDGIADLRIVMDDMRRESAEAHAKATDTMHSETRRLDEKMSAGRNELFHRIDAIKDLMIAGHENAH